MYRFRKPKHLIDYSELENQEIYFSDLASLNDPMEGYRKYYWQGDIIVWKNFIKHFILCFEQTYTLAKLMEKNESLTSDDIPVFVSFSNLPTERYRTLISEIIEIVFKTEKFEEFLLLISNNNIKVGRNEVYFYLRMIHIITLNAIIKIHTKYGFQEPPDNEPPDLSKIFVTMVPAFAEFSKKTADYESKAEDLFSITKSIFSQMDLAIATKNQTLLEGNKEYFILSEFPSAYLDAILKLTYPETYVACFIDNCLNPVVWSHYGDNHQGVALKFRTIEENSNNLLELHGAIGYSSGDKYIFDKRKYPLVKIKYSDEYPDINFFRSLGRLPVGILSKEWFTDDANKKSEIYDIILKENNSTWRSEYWGIYMQTFFQKLSQWEYESEYRIALTDNLGIHIDKTNRKLRYDFDSLEGIVFGMKTPNHMKTKIIEIIGNKCKKANRKDFNFYQIEYDANRKEMSEVKLGLIKF